MTGNEPGKLAQNIAEHLRFVRKSRGLSLDKTSTLTGVSKAMLGQIERGESSPTIATLWKIATGLDCSFSSFLVDGATSSGAAETNHDEGFLNDPNMKVKTLFPFSSLTHFEVFELRLMHFHEQRSTAHQIGVTEHIHVTKGTLSVFKEGEWCTYHEGEQCLLRADQAHGYRDEVGDTHFIAIIHYPVNAKYES